MILASAIRCRNCGAILGSVRPEDSNAYEQRKAAEGRLPALRRGVVWLFIFCIIPFTAPIAAIGGVYWYLSNRQDLKRLPSLHQAVLKISLCVALGQTLFTVLAVVAFGWGRG
jgi:ABC-type Fe3+ transport system permease subunit